MVSCYFKLEVPTLLPTVNNDHWENINKNALSCLITVKKQRIQESKHENCYKVNITRSNNDNWN